MSTERVFLSLGSNLGDRQANLEQAIAALESPQLNVTACSSIYETEPQDVTDQPWFLNMVLACQTACSPPQLLAHIHHIEQNAGRTRIGVSPRGPRIIDIDILLFGSVLMNNEELTIPHPRMMERRFVVEPLLEIAPELWDPLTGEAIAAKLAGLQGQATKKLGAATPRSCPAD